MLMLKSTHERLVHKEVVSATAAMKRLHDAQIIKLEKDIYELQARKGQLHILLDTAKSEIETMKPLYEIGKRYQANQDAANERRRAQRAFMRREKT